MLAGRPGPIRSLFEVTMKGCHVVNDDPVYPILNNFYLGLYEEQQGNRDPACAQYAKVLERWGHAKPRSVIADDARAHATKLGCAQPVGTH